MDAIDVKGLPEDEAQLIKNKFYQRVREMQEQAKGLEPKNIDKVIAEAVEAVKKQVMI